ncbi:phage tail protein [Aeromonas caviae]
MAELTIGTIISITMASMSLAASVFTLVGGKPGSVGGEDPGVAVNRKGSDNPKIITWGDTRIPAVRTYTNVNNNNSEMLVQQYSLGWGPLRSVEEIYIDGVPYFKTSGDKSNSWTTKGAEFPNVQMGIRRGLATETAWSQIISNSDGELSNKHRGDRTGSVSLLVQRQVNMSGDNNVRFISPQVSIEALVQGNAVIDPRFDPALQGAADMTKRKWVDGSVISYRNPALCLLTYCLDTNFGMGLPVDTIDTSSFILAANYCDQYNLKCDGFTSADSDHGTVIKELASSFSAMVYLENGLLTVRPHAKRVVKYTITENDLLNENSISISNNNQNDYANAIVVEFQNKQSEYNADKYALPANKWTDPTIQADGNVKEFSLKLPYTTDPDTVKRLANEALKIRKYSNKSGKITLDNNDYNLKIGDVIRLVHKPLAVDSLFSVESISGSLDNKVMQSEITLSEYRDEFFDNNYQDGIISGSQGNPSIVVLPVTGLNFVQNNTLTTGSGILNWTNQYKGDCSFRVEYRRSGAAVWSYYNEVRTESCLITQMIPGVNYDFRVLVVTAYKTSSWTQLNNVRVNRSISLPALTGLSGNFLNRDASFVWNPTQGSIPNNSVVGDGITDLSQLVSHYEVSVKHGAVAKKSYRVASPRFIYSYEENAANGLSREITITVKAVSIYGDSSPETTLTVRNEPMVQPSGVKVDAQLKSLTVTWDNPSETIPDYASTDIYLLPDPQTVASNQYQIATSNTGNFTKLMPDNQKSGYIRIAHRDVFGHTSPITGSPAMLYTQTTIDDLLTDSEFESNIETIESNLAQAQADITKAKTDILTNASEINTVKNTVSAQGVQITNVQTVANSNTGKIASLETELSAAEADLDAKITTNKNAITTTNQAMTSMDTRLTSAVGSNTSAIQQQGIAISNLDSSLSLYKTENTAEVNGVKSSVTAISQAQASTDGKVNSLYTLRVDANGKVAGMSLGATPQGSTVDFLSDTFRIANSTTGTPATVFEVRGGNTMIKNAFIGNLVASQISADAINGNHIAANSIIQAGSGATSATLNGSDANWRIYAGSTTPGSAPFRVSSTGALVATNATITGAITATSGSFSGAITASSGSISGRLTMNGGFIDGRFGQDSINLGSGTFRVDNNGNLYASNGTFGGTIYADKVSGDIVNAGLFTFPAVSGTVNSGILHDVFRMNVPAVSWERYMLISLIPLNWRSLENGGRFNMYVRDSTGRNTTIFGENKPMGTIDGYPSLDNFSIRIPANATWVALSIQGDRRQSVGFGQLPIETNWQVFKAGSGGISIVV